MGCLTVVSDIIETIRDIPAVTIYISYFFLIQPRLQAMAAINVFIGRDLLSLIS